MKQFMAAQEPVCRATRNEYVQSAQQSLRGDMELKVLTRTRLSLISPDVRTA
jgi:hypothetical protein